MLEFEPITLEKKKMMDQYLSGYGENSCQHSFVSSYCMEAKYGDRICEKENYLYVLRSGKCIEKERVYLFPMGNTSNEESLSRAIAEIIADAHQHDAFVRFETLTKTAKDAVLRLFPGRFRAEPVRDYWEYLYTYEKLALLPGREMASKRYDINTFFRDYGERTVIDTIRPEYIEDIRKFQKNWLENKIHMEEDVQLELEDLAIQSGLTWFKELGLSGIVVYIDGKLCGYAYGAPLSKECYDVIIEKGDRSIPDIYRILNRELVRMCCQGYTYINREEDVGAEGLRKAKLSYKPDILLEKFIVREVPEDE